MFEKKKFQIVAKCIDEIQSGKLNREDCLRMYPQFSKEFKDVFPVLELIDLIHIPDISEIDRRKQKIALMQKIPNRSDVVTKSLNHRFRFKNLQWRFNMSWVLIFSTVLSLISGAGAVYASADALPGDVLYSVKTMVEDAQLAMASDETDPELFIGFSETRVQEMLELVKQARFIDVNEAAAGYENHTKSLEQIMARLRVQDPEEAVRLRMKLEEKLKEQARLMQICSSDEEEIEEEEVCEPLRIMLRANNRLRQHLQVNDDATNNSQNNEQNNQQDNQQNSEQNQEQNNQQNCEQDCDQNSEQNQQQNSEQNSEQNQEQNQQQNNQQNNEQNQEQNQQQNNQQNCEQNTDQDNAQNNNQNNQQNKEENNKNKGS